MSAEIKFHLDENVNPAVATGLRRRGVNVVTTQELGLLGAPNPRHIQTALQQDRVIFTQDDDFLKLHAQGVEHAGIVYAHQGTSIGQIVRGLMLVYYELGTTKVRLGHYPSNLNCLYLERFPPTLKHKFRLRIPHPFTLLRLL